MWHAGPLEAQGQNRQCHLRLISLVKASPKPAQSLEERQPPTPAPPWEVPRVTSRRGVTRRRFLGPCFANNLPQPSVSRVCCIRSSGEFCPVGSVIFTSQMRKGVRCGCGYLLEVTQLAGGRVGTQTVVSPMSEPLSPLLPLPGTVGYRSRLGCRLLLSGKGITVLSKVVLIVSTDREGCRPVVVSMFTVGDGQLCLPASHGGHSAVRNWDLY